jgi:HK97 gp10 family phage protein
MAGIFFNVTEFDEAIIKLESLTQKVKNQIIDETNASALKIQSEAKKNAPANFGTLRGSIHLKEEGGIDKKVYIVGSDLSYAPYVEFGTGGKVNTQGYNEFANTFRGKTGGTFQDMLKALVLWVKRKGITGTYSIKTQRRTGSRKVQSKENDSAAYAIALSILRKGLRPQPYLIPAYETEVSLLKDRIKNIVNAQS